MSSKASVLIAVYKGMRDLELVLTGYCRQSFRDFEVVIADDGSGPEMQAFVDSFSRRAPFSLQYVYQPDEGFRKGRILNQAILASSAPYLIFADADCIPQLNFVLAHVENQEARTVLHGRRVNLSPRMSRMLTPEDILAGRLDHPRLRLIVDALVGRTSRLEEGIEIKNQMLRAWMNRTEPVLFGSNFSLERSLLKQVNGFNEDFIDYWGEDTELGHRLRNAGAPFRWVRHLAIQYHLYHPPRAKTERSCVLLERSRTNGMATCRNGLRKTDAANEEIDLSTTTPALPKDVANYLVADNPQLIDLRKRYAAHSASVHSLWSPSFVQGNINLHKFRTDNAYIWQSRGPVTEQTYFRTAEYVKRADRLSIFDRVTEDGMFGVQRVAYNGKDISRDLLDSVLEMNAICELLKTGNLNGVQLLDVGAGYGRLAHRIVEAYPGVKGIIVSDAIPESTFLSDFYLKFRSVEEKAIVVPLDNIQETLLSRAKSIDIAVNVHSFSECTFASIHWWLGLIRSAEIPRLLIVPNTRKRLVSTEENGKRKDFGRILRDYGYRQVLKRSKFVDAPELDKFGLYPTWYHGFELRG